MWIVQVALRRPYTFIVPALLLAILGWLTIERTAKDIFPRIDIPVVSVIWTYSGLPPDEMSGRVTGSFERAALVTVNNIEHIESQSLTGVSVVKFFFHPGANVDLSMSQLTAISQTWLKQLPPGITPPLILAYNAIAAAESTRHAYDLYTGGLQSYFDVVEAQNIELAARLSDADIRTRRMTASVLLIKALGGGWHRDELESASARQG